MDIKLPPAGTKCLIDANIFVYHLGMKAGGCPNFLDRVARREIEAHITTTVIAEVLHRQMLIKAVNNGLATPGKTLNKLKNDPTILMGLTDYVAEVEKLLRLPLAVTEVMSAEVTRSHSLRRTHGLFVNDLINSHIFVQDGGSSDGRGFTKHPAEDSPHYLDFAWLLNEGSNAIRNWPKAEHSRL